MRNARLTLDLVDDLKKIGVEVYFVNDGIWSFNPDDYFKLTIMAQYAEQESRKISERVFSGQAIAKSNGIHFGNGNILGYDIKKGDISKNTTYVVNEEQAETVRTIFTLCSLGWGMKRIKNYLIENNYKNSVGECKWYESTICKILKRRTYLGEYEYGQSVTKDPLTHERVTNHDRSKRIIMKATFPPIIDNDLWELAQSQVAKRRVNYKKENSNEVISFGVRNSNDIYCKKLRCGCGRRFRRDVGRKDGMATYRCYQLIDDGSQKKRAENSKLLEDDCSVNGIIDWKLDFFTVSVFEFLKINHKTIINKVKEIIEKFDDSISDDRSFEEEKEIEKKIANLEKQNKKLIELYKVDGIDIQEYMNERSKNLEEIKSLNDIRKKLAGNWSDNIKQTSKKEILDYIDNLIAFPEMKDNIAEIPSVIIETFVNSIKACANNVYEYSINFSKQNQDDGLDINAKHRCINNSESFLVGEIILTYSDAKTYANKRKRKVVRVHWKTPVTIKIYATL